MRRNLILAFFFCSIATAGFAQSSVNGKWATDRPADPLLVTDAERRGRVQLDVDIENGKASGSFTIGGLGGTFYTFKDGTLNGNKVQFRTDPPNAPRATWTIELVDDNTVKLGRGPLELVSNNILDLIALLPGARPATPGIQPAPVAQPAPRENALIRGAVQDQSKAPIPGVTLTATNLLSNAGFTAVSDGAGQYGFTGVTPGNYTISASLPGFDTRTISNITIVDTQLVQDFTLKVHGAEELPNTPAGLCAATSWCAVLHRAK